MVRFHWFFSICLTFSSLFCPVQCLSHPGIVFRAPKWTTSQFCCQLTFWPFELLYLFIDWMIGETRGAITCLQLTSMLFLFQSFSAGFTFIWIVLNNHQTTTPVLDTEEQFAQEQTILKCCCYLSLFLCDLNPHWGLIFTQENKWRQNPDILIVKLQTNDMMV